MIGMDLELLSCPPVQLEGKAIERDAAVPKPTRQSLLADEPSTAVTMKALLLLIALAARQVNFIEYQIKIQDRCLKGIAPWR